MTSVAIAERPAASLPKEQLDLIRRTVANGATNDELALFLYDCERRGIHPLDKLLHFTKRGGKYTPVTSIDYMRAQAAASGEMAGSDDPIFGDANMAGHPDAATVTVYRMTQGQRFAYTATARWAEYCPDNAAMWRRMPHTMLGKCAEALALRKAFPQQLAGLYAKEEMDQAEEPRSGYSVQPMPAREGGTAPASETAARSPQGSLDGSQGQKPTPAPADDGPSVIADGLLRIVKVDITDTRNKNVRKALITVSTGETFSTINPSLTGLASELAQEGCPVTIESKDTRWGPELTGLHRNEGGPTVPEPVVTTAPLTSDEIPF